MGQVRPARVPHPARRVKDDTVPGRNASSVDPMTAKPSAGAHELRTEALEASALRRLRRKESGKGVLTIPAVPSLREHYLKKLLDAFAVLGRPANQEEAEALSEMLGRLMVEAWQESPYARVIVRYETAANPDDGISYHFEPVTVSVADAYDSWVEVRPQPFFGAEANAKVLHLARSLGPPESVAILDVGAAEGRNTIPLAKEGFATDAVELSPEFAKLLHARLLEAKVGARVFMGDVLDRRLQIPTAHYDLIVIAGVVVAHFRTVAHLRTLMERMCELLHPGGHLLFNVFLTLDGYEPSSKIRELAELFWTVMFTPAEIAEALVGLPLQLIDDVSYVKYECEHAPESWPPTDYFEAYCAGQDLFDLPAGRAPMEMRWLTYRKHGEPGV
jgi:SAM-dependent methyltransferase